MLFFLSTVKMETKRIVEYEQQFLAAYQQYLEGLENMIKTVEQNKNPAVKVGIR